MNVAILKAMGIECVQSDSSGRSGSRESYWELVLWCVRHTISAGSHRQELCPFLKIKQPEQQKPKPSGSFSVNSEVKQHRALQSTQMMTAGKKMFCTCFSSVDVESFSSKLCFHQGNCFCILTFDSFFFKDTNIFFLTTGTGQLQV